MLSEMKNCIHFGNYLMMCCHHEIEDAGDGKFNEGTLSDSVPKTAYYELSSVFYTKPH